MITDKQHRQIEKRLTQLKSLAARKHRNSKAHTTRLINYGKIVAIEQVQKLLGMSPASRERLGARAEYK